MRLIVPGASGFIGRNFVRATPSDWEVVALYYRNKTFPDWVERERLLHVTAVGCDLTDANAVRLLAGELGPRFDACVYLAANGDPAYSVPHPMEDLQANVVTLMNFLIHFEVGKLVYFSSGAVYDGLSGPVSPAVPVFPRLPYAISHLACEHYARAFAHHGRLGSYINLRFFGAFGPYEPARKIYTKLVQRFHFENDPHFTIRGDGRNYIDAMFVDDAIQGVMVVLESDKGNLTVDFCIGVPLTINELVNRAARAFGHVNAAIEHTGSVPEYITFYASGQAMEQLFGFRPRISLEDGLHHLAEFLAQQGEEQS